MSQIDVIIIKKGYLYHSKSGFRFILQLINNNFRNLSKYLAIFKKKQVIDRGYILFDFDSKVILSNQSCFSSSHIDPEVRRKIRKEFEFYEVF